jgi:pimeloyl-ACP methyl ester carboxylesterase
MIQAFDNTKLIGHYYEREKGAPLIVFFHGLWGHSYLDGVPIYRITQKHNWNLLLCDLRAQGDSEGEFSTLGVLEKYDCLDWVEWAQNRFGDKNPIFLMGVSMGASIVMMSSDLELPDSVYGIIDDCGFTSTLDVIK